MQQPVALPDSSGRRDFTGGRAAQRRLDRPFLTVPFHRNIQACNSKQHDADARDDANDPSSCHSARRRVVRPRSKYRRRVSSPELTRLQAARSSSIPSPNSPIDVDTLSIASFSRWQPDADGHSPTTIALEREGETILILAHPNAPRQRGGPFSCIDVNYFEFRPRGLVCGIRSGACVGDMIMQEPPFLYSASCATPLDEFLSQKNFIEAKRDMRNSEAKLVHCLGELHRRCQRVQSHVLDLFYSNTFRLPHTKDGCTLQFDFLFLTLAQIRHRYAGPLS